MTNKRPGRRSVRPVNHVRHPRFRAGLAALLLIAGGLLLPLQALRAQITVDLSIKRTIYMAYEPLLATVRITNLSGQRLLMADVEGKKWFGFQVETLEGRPLPPSDANYEIEPIQIGPGESITRTVNLTQHYPISDCGRYRIRASVYSAELASYFSSPPLTVEITDGRIIWEQTVGVPGREGLTGSTRTINLLSHRLSDRTDLYLRIEDRSSGIVYCTHRLGDFIAYGKPDIMLDTANIIHVLQNNIPREFIYSKVGLDGKILDRMSFHAPKDRPHLAKGPDGSVYVLGGQAYDAKATPTPGMIPTLSDRPAGLPTPEEAPTPAQTGKSKPTPKPKAAPKATPTPSPVKVD